MRINGRLVVPYCLRGTLSTIDGVFSGLLDLSLGVLSLALIFPVGVAGDLAFKLLRRTDELIFLSTHVWSSIAGHRLPVGDEGCLLWVT